MSDLIDRQQAIDAVVNHSYPVRYDFGFTSIENGMTVTGIRQALSELPSAEPQIIACGEGEVTDMSNYSDTLWRLAYERGKAEAEPQERKGKWIDCVNSEHWKCSNCGCRSAYWFNEDGLAEWLSDYCPNCGARMEGTDGQTVE